MRKIHVLTMVLLALTVCASSAWAQGFGVYEHSSCAAGRGGTAVAAPCPDASSIFFNPAGIVITPGQELSIGASLIGPRGDFTDTTTQVVSSLNNHFYPVPAVFYKRNIKNDRFAVGAGMFAPYGLTTDWPETSQGRFLGYKSLVQSIYVQPTAAMKVNDKISLGLGLDFVYAKVEMRQHLDLSVQPVPAGLGVPAGTTFGMLGVPTGTDFANVVMKGNDWHTGFHLGFHAVATEKVSIGARYQSGIRPKMNDGTVNYSQILTGIKLKNGLALDPILASAFMTGQQLSSPQTASTNIPLPDQLIIGTALQVAPKVKVLADYQWIHWSMFETLVIDQSIAPTKTVMESYNDTNGIRLGVEYSLDPKSVIRAGFIGHSAAAPDQTVTPNLPEAARTEYTFGYGRQLNGKFRLDAYYQYLHQSDRAGRTTDGGMAVPTPAVNNGTYSFMSHLFGITVGMGF